MIEGIELVVFYIKLIGLVIDFVIGAIMLRKTIKIEFKQTKTYFLGATLFFLTHGVCRTFFFLRSYFYNQLEYRFLFLIGTILGLLSVIVIVYAVESVIFTKSKYFFTIFGFIGVVLMIIFSIFEGTYLGLPYIVLVQYLFTPPLAIFIILIYFSHIFKSEGKIQVHFTLMTIAIILLGVGEMGNTSTARVIVPLSVWLAPTIMLIGLFLIYVSVTRYYKVIKD